ncbi:hypothetical protein BGZ63DRAFT_190922 [Mariannaea sp. PMI_226]|nr:hypothetical protein BGZ63DRAFT_190922 [Mariannaea sp. PMI_226]
MIGPRRVSKTVTRCNCGQTCTWRWASNEALARGSLLQFTFLGSEEALRKPFDHCLGMSKSWHPGLWRMDGGLLVTHNSPIGFLELEPPTWIVQGATPSRKAVKLDGVPSNVFDALLDSPPLHLLCPASMGATLSMMLMLTAVLVSPPFFHSFLVCR